jgi:pilus assembly protein CpaC
MHRTKRCLKALTGGLLLALLLSGFTAGSSAQGPPAGTTGSALIVPINGTVRVQMKSKKPIKTVTVPVPDVIQVRTMVGDPTVVLVTGQNPNVTRIELEDVDGAKETYEVIVQLDVEYLRTQLRRVVPTANIVPIPTSSNSVTLTGYVSHAEDLGVVQQVAASFGGLNVINALRVGGPYQVQVDVVVASVDRSEFRRMAFDFLVNGRHTFFASTIGQAAVNPQLIGTGTTFSVAPGLQGTVGTPNGAPVNLFGGVLHSGWNFLYFLQALRDENVLKTLAEPRVVTMSGRPASFLSGGEQAIPVPAGLGQVGVQFEEFGTRVNLLPIVLGNGKIHLEIEPEVSNLDAAAGTTIQGTIVPGRVVNRINTTVELEPGQTFVLGGLIQHDVVANAQKVPVVGDLPFLGTLFSTKSYLETERELLILVTPHLVDALDCSQMPKLFPGQETRSPDDFELFLEGILEAPRGPRQVCPGGCYSPAFKNGPSYELFPCAGKGNCGGDCGGNGYPTNGCATGSCNWAPKGPAATVHAGPASPAAAPPPAAPVAAPAAPPAPSAAAADGPTPMPPATSEAPMPGLPATPAGLPGVPGGKDD